MALIKTDYEDVRLQPTRAGHPLLATPRANYFLLVHTMGEFKSYSGFFFLYIVRLTDFQTGIQADSVFFKKLTHVYSKSAIEIRTLN
jgi:hypothetical protein